MTGRNFMLIPPPTTSRPPSNPPTRDPASKRRHKNRHAAPPVRQHAEGTAGSASKSNKDAGNNPTMASENAIVKSGQLVGEDGEAPSWLVRRSARHFPLV